MQTGSRLVVLFVWSGGGGSVFHSKYKTPCFLSRSPHGCFYVLHQAAEFIFIPNLNLMNIYFAEFARLRNESIMKEQFHLWGSRQNVSFLEKPSEE